MTSDTAFLFILLFFVLGYLAIIFEHSIKVNKTASALLMAVITWLFFFLTGGPVADKIAKLGENLNEVSQIIFFLGSLLANSGTE